MPYASDLAGLLTWCPVAPLETNWGDKDHGQVSRWMKDFLDWWSQKAIVNILK